MSKEKSEKEIRKIVDASSTLSPEQIFEDKEEQTLEGSITYFKTQGMIITPQTKTDDRITNLEKEITELKKRLNKLEIKSSLNKYDIFNEFIKTLIDIGVEKLTNFEIITESTEDDSLICWIVIPVNKKFREKDFREYNQIRLKIMGPIHQIIGKYENCSFNIISDFEFNEIKDSIDIELDYLFSELIG